MPAGGEVGGVVCGPAEMACHLALCIRRQRPVEDAEGRLQCKAEGPVIATGPDIPIIGHAGVKFDGVHEVIQGLSEIHGPGSSGLEECKGSDFRRGKAGKGVQEG